MNVTKRRVVLIYVADPLGLYNDGWGWDVKSTTPLNFSIKFSSLITLFLRPITHRSVFGHFFPSLPILGRRQILVTLLAGIGSPLLLLLPAQVPPRTTRRYDILQLSPCQGHRVRVQTHFQGFPWGCRCSKLLVTER